MECTLEELFLHFLLLFDIVNGYKILHYKIPVTQLVKKANQVFMFNKKKA